MDIVKELEQIEDKYYGEWEENKAAMVEAMTELHKRELADPDQFNRFMVQTSDRFGGAYIPYLFWTKLSSFVGENQDDRFFLQQLIKAFVNSNFDEEEQRVMKPLLITYFNAEKEFELNKVWTKIVDPAHPSVREYFQKLLNFTKKNQKSTEMYAEKFMMLRNIHPQLRDAQPPHHPTP